MWTLTWCASFLTPILQCVYHLFSKSNSATWINMDGGYSFNLDKHIVSSQISNFVQTNERQFKRNATLSLFPHRIGERCFARQQEKWWKMFLWFSFFSPIWIMGSTLSCNNNLTYLRFRSKQNTNYNRMQGKSALDEEWMMIRMKKGLNPPTCGISQNKMWCDVSCPLSNACKTSHLTYKLFAIDVYKNQIKMRI